MSKKKRPIILTVLDGWGHRVETEGNAIALARKPAYDQLIRNFPNTLIHTSGPYVGLPEGQMGNSEVGHMNMGAGRIVHMDMTRIDLLVANNQMQDVPLFQQAMERGKTHQLHIMGLLSDGGVHSHINHLFALLEMAKQSGVQNVFVHCFMDGRDTPPHSGKEFVQQLQKKMRDLGVGKIATLVGRYYAMDRDNRWERIELAYQAIVHGEAEIRTSDPVAALEKSYAQEVTDEFIKPIVVVAAEDSAAKPVTQIRDEDAVIFYNYRADRARQMTYALAAPDFDKFADPRRPKNLFYVGMTQYDKNWPWLKFVIAPEKMEQILAQVFGELQYKNLRTAETEKYAHVTYFFNGGMEKPFAGEERILVPSPKVATYDLKPEMSAQGITDTVVKAIQGQEFDAIIMNYANADMVGHSGKLEAAIKAVEAVDAGLAQIYQALKARFDDAAWLITADHGNAEMMIDPNTGGAHTYHTTNPVPLILVSGEKELRLRPNGSLRDIAPTMLSALGQLPPAEMSGADLCVRP
ncbi:MAG TPA: 2,3-bisphosphoglycerate-independent phosphoglycerate mutase [Candidatus Dormibacteraeota bacterium]|nr:2,3-bisphosphoglycerate-independent phosphoglycerate mutase [Candidatus Dormibacteraeota bacterium]